MGFSNNNRGFLLFLVSFAIGIGAGIGVTINDNRGADVGVTTATSATTATGSKDMFRINGVQAAAEEAGSDGEKYEFQAETHRLLDILINSLYSDTSIFMRELISNCADALDKVRFLSIQDESVLTEGGEEMEVRVSFDKEDKTIHIRDTGIGMTKEDLIQNLGTVAKSGTTQFVEALAEGGGDLSLIGQFGVGFYSSFLVADKVIVKSKSNDDPVQHVWESTADSTFSVKEDSEGNTLGRGTELILHLKEDATDFLNQDKLEKLIQRYSEFITFPIYLRKSKTETVEVEDEEDADAEEEEEEDEEEEDEEDDEEEGEGDDEGKKKKKKKKTKEVTTWSWVRVNTQPPIWTRSPEEVSEDEYKSFYKSVAKDQQDPLVWNHFKAEGEIEFKSILYIPKVTPSDLFENYYGKSSSIRLYVRKVLISDSFEELMPKYLNFIKGVLDSEDLPLNVSREQLQQNKILQVIQKKLVRKVLDMIRKLQDTDDDEDEEVGGAEDTEDKYSVFWENFGKNIKLGVIEDSANRNKLLKLLRFHSSETIKESDDTLTSLEEYVERMPDWQKSIYYIASDSLDTLKGSPFLERANAKGIEVLLFDDPTDEYMLQHLHDFDGKKLVSLTKEGLKFGDETDEEKKREKIYKEQYKSLANWMKKVLGQDKVEKVTVSNRVTDTPAVLVTGQYGFSANMERISRTQTFGNSGAYMKAKRTLEVNPRHPIIGKLKQLVEEKGLADADEDVVDDSEERRLALTLYDAAAVSSGFDIDHPKDFASRMVQLLGSGMQVDASQLLPEVEIPSEEEEEEEEEEEANQGSGTEEPDMNEL